MTRGLYLKPGLPHFAAAARCAMAAVSCDRELVPGLNQERRGKMKGAVWSVGKDGNAECRMRIDGCECVKMRLLRREDSFWLECREMELFVDEESGDVAGRGWINLRTTSLRKAQEAAERTYETWVEDQISHYSRILEEIFGRTVWS